MADEIRIERGTPTEEELAALVTVLLSRRSAPVADVAVPVSRWARSARPRAVVRGADAWRGSALPR